MLQNVTYPEWLFMATFDHCEISAAATEDVLNSAWAKRNGIVCSEQISSGGCERWARLVVRRLPGSRLLWENGHCWVDFYGSLFDSDTSYDDLVEIQKAVVQILEER